MFENYFNTYLASLNIPEKSVSVSFSKTCGFHDLKLIIEKLLYCCWLKTAYDFNDTKVTKLKLSIAPITDPR